MIGVILQERYQIESEIGRGGMGVVYRAQDLLLNRPVAVKILSDASSASASKDRMLVEARVGARLNHPHIVGTYDAGELEGRPFIVMELVEGETLRQRRPDALADALQIAIQVCDALDHAHASGIIHRDLKPENVVLTQTQGAKLMDFGLARAVDTPSLTAEGAIIGTFLYLAPELLLGQAPTPQSDLYALGMVLYELVCGRHPFTGENLMAIISQHLNAPVVPPSTYNSEIPLALDRLIVRLLAKQPFERVQSAAEVRQILERLASPGEEPEAAPAAVQPLSVLDRIARGRLVGREREMSEARLIWKRTLAGEGHILLISGEPGIGKTRLARELASAAEVGRGLALFGECYAEGNVPFAPIEQVLRQVYMEKGWRLPNLPEMVLADLITVAPVLRTIYPRIPVNPSLDPQAEQQRLFESVVIFFSALAQRMPVLLLIDDAHWADSGSLYLLRHLARRSRRTPLLIIMTYREIELDQQHAFNEVVADLNRERLAVRLKLNRLGIEQAREMLGMMFGMQHDQVSDEFIQGIYQETEGNPFFLEEVVKALVEDGKIYHQDGRWVRVRMDEMQVPQSVRIAVQARVNKLDEPVQDALRMAAVLGREFDYETLLRALEADDDTLIGAMEQAERAQLVNEVPAKKHSGQSASGSSVTFAFAHALIPSMLRESISSLRRQRMHRRAAVALETLYPDDYEALAYHYSQAGDEAKARHYFYQAGLRAASLYIHQDAIRFLSEALELTPNDDPQRYEILAARTSVYELTSQRTEQLQDARALLALSEQQANQEHIIDALLALTNVYLETEPHTARQTAERAAKLAHSLGDPAREGLALRRIGQSSLVLFDRGLSQQSLEASVACFRKANRPDELAASLGYLAMAYEYGGRHPEQLGAVEEALALNRRTGNKRQEAFGLRRLAIIYNNQGRYAEAQAATEEALALLRSVGDRVNEGHALNNLGYIISNQHHYAEAEQYYLQALQISEENASMRGVWNAIFNLGWFVYFNQGQYQRSLQLFDQYIDVAKQLEDSFLLSRVEATRAVLLMLLGRYEQALQAKQAGMQGPDALRSQTMETADLALIGNILSLMGRYTDARMHLEQSLQQAEQSGQPLELIDALFGLSKLAYYESGEQGLQTAAPMLVRMWSLVKDTNFYDWMGAIASLMALQQAYAGEREAALDFARQSVEAMTKDDAHAPDEVLMRLLIYRAYKIVGENDQARTIIRPAYEWVDLVASQMDDERLRRSWLENVPHNRHVVEAWMRENA